MFRGDFCGFLALGPRLCKLWLVENLQPPTYYAPGDADFMASPVLPPLGPDNPPWTLGAAFAVFLVSLACLFIVPLIVVAPYLAYLTRQGVPVTTEALGQNATVILLSLLGTIPAHLLTLFVIWRVVTKGGKYSFKEMVGWDITPQEIVWCFAGAMGLYVVALGLLYFSNGAETPMEQMVKSSSLARYTTAFLAVVTAPLVEELVYRGLLYSSLRQRFSPAIAVGVVTVLFAAIHGPQYSTNLAVLGVILMLSLTLTLVRVRTQRILPSVVIHTIFNGVQAVLLVLGLDLEKPEKAAGMLWLWLR